MHLPVIQGTIKRRLLVNYRADPGVVQRILPPPFRPKLHPGHGEGGSAAVLLILATEC